MPSFAETVFEAQVAESLLQYAKTVVTEATTTTNHTARVALVTSIKGDQAGYIQLFADIIRAAYGITAASTQADILTAVGQAWTDFAGNI